MKYNIIIIIVKGIPSFRKILCHLKNGFLLQLKTFRNTHVLQFYNLHHVNDLFMIMFGKVKCENQAIYIDIFPIC